MLLGKVQIEIHLASVGVGEFPGFEIDENEAFQTAVKKHQVNCDQGRGNHGMVLISRGPNFRDTVLRFCRVKSVPNSSDGVCRFSGVTPVNVPAPNCADAVCTIGHVA